MTAIEPDLHAEIAAAADDLLARALSHPDTRRDTLHAGWSTALWSAIADAGWFNLLLDDELGGLGLDLDALGPVFAAAGRHLVPGPLLEHALVVPLLANDRPQAEQLLEPGDRGLTVLVDAIANAERSDVGAPHIGDTGHLEGSCDLVSFAAEADRFVVVAEDRTDGGSARVLLVDAAAPGVRVDPTGAFDPLAHYSTVRFDSSEDYLVIADDAGELLARLRGAQRLMLSFQLAGMARHLLDASVTYAGDRHQFGQPIGAFQAVQHLLADMCTQTLAAEALATDATAASVADPLRLPTEGRIAKAVAAATARTVGEGALQVHGGIAFTAEHDLHRWLLHSLALQGRYGDHTGLSAELGHRLVAAELDLWP